MASLILFDDMKTAQRFMYLDGVRGVASLMVALSHYVIAFYTTLLSGLPAQSHSAWDRTLSHSTLIVLYNPNLGVAIFFILSGFVLAASVADHQPAWPALVLRRWVRLCFPVLGTTLLIFMALHAGAFHDAQTVAAVTKSPWLAELWPPVTYWISVKVFIRNCLFTLFTGSDGAVQLLNATLWTMPIELLGSITLFAGYCLFADVFRRSRGCFAVAIAASVFTWNTPYYGFGLGVALFEIRRGISYFPPVWCRRFGRAAGPLGLVALFTGIWFGGTPFAPSGLHQEFLNNDHRIGLNMGILEMQHTGAALLVIAALLLRPLQQFLSTGICQYLGRISFMLYLVQLPALCSAPLWVFMHTGHQYHVRAMLALATYLVLAIGIADVATRLIDRPAIRLSRLATRPPAELWRESKRFFFEKKKQKTFVS